MQKTTYLFEGLLHTNIVHTHISQMNIINEIVLIFMVVLGLVFQQQESEKIWINNVHWKIFEP